MQLYELINQIHLDCFRLCKIALNKFLPIAGNIGIFCQSEEDFKNYSAIKDQITKPSSNPDQKYFKLIYKITIPSINDVPETTYEYLYIRKPALDTPHLGDVDFILGRVEFESLKQQLLKGKDIAGAQIYNRPGWDMIELSNPNINSLAYVTYMEMAERVRVKFN